MASTGRSVLIGDPAAELAQVVVEARPRLVGHQVEVDVLAFGQPEERGRCAPGSRRPATRSPARSVLDRHRLRLPPGDAALAQRPAPGQDLVERAVGGREDAPRRPAGAHAVAGARSRRRSAIGDAGQLARRWCGGRRPGPGASGGGGGRRGVVDRHAGVEVGEQAAGVGRPASSGADRARPSTRSAQRRRPVVGVDEPVDVAAEPRARARGSGGPARRPAQSARPRRYPASGAADPASVVVEQLGHGRGVGPGGQVGRRAAALRPDHAVGQVEGHDLLGGLPRLLASPAARRPPARTARAGSARPRRPPTPGRPAWWAAAATANDPVGETMPSGPAQLASSSTRSLCTAAAAAPASGTSTASTSAPRSRRARAEPSPLASTQRTTTSPRRGRAERDQLGPAHDANRSPRRAAGGRGGRRWGRRRPPRRNARPLRPGRRSRAAGPTASRGRRPSGAGRAGAGTTRSTRRRRCRTRPGRTTPRAPARPGRPRPPGPRSAGARSGAPGDPRARASLRESGRGRRRG